MAVRAVRGTVWTLIGGALTYLLLQALGELGLALVIALVIAGLVIPRIPNARSEAVALAAGPAILFMIIGETDDAPGLVLVGIAILAAVAARYLRLRRGPSATAA
jgi:hypothetical protein